MKSIARIAIEGKSIAMTMEYENNEIDRENRDWGQVDRENYNAKVNELECLSVYSHGSRKYQR
jgi:hypothetical protein